MLDLETFKKQTIEQIDTNSKEIKALQVEMEAFVSAQKRFNELLVTNQYLQAISNNLDMLMGQDVNAAAEDPWAPLVGQA